jgi:hypothetical protein
MAGKSDFLELEVLDHVLGNSPYTAPATVLVALYTAAPTDSGGGTEVSAGGYARVSVANNPTNWPAAAFALKSNGTDIVFGVPTANWGTVGWFGIFDPGGNLLYWGDLLYARTITNGDLAPRFEAGSLSVTED